MDLDAQGYDCVVPQVACVFVFLSQPVSEILDHLCVAYEGRLVVRAVYWTGSAFGVVLYPSAFGPDFV